MNLSRAIALLQKLRLPVIRTNDAAAIWNESRATASTMLSRLQKLDLVHRVSRGLWLIERDVNPLSLHPYFTEPAPSYLSLTTALFHHGMIEQIPSIIYVVTTSKPKVIESPVGKFSIHQVAPTFFCGFEPFNGGPAQMAVPEKALVDFLYFRPTRTRLFRALPEVSLPRRFKMKSAFAFADLISSKQRKNMVKTLLSEIMKL